MHYLTIAFLIGTFALLAIMLAIHFFGVIHKNKILKPTILFKKYFHTTRVKPSSRDIVAGTSYLVYTADDNSTVAALTLTCSFMTHLYCFVNQDPSHTDNRLVARTRLSKIDLSLMPHDFHLYCVKEDTNKLLQIFDTQTLSYLSDFCKSYDLEIADNQLLLAQKLGVSGTEVDLKSDANQLYQVINPKTIEWYRQVQNEFSL
ncbi:hypothetical protein KBB76_00895 [Candidatus Saccharibacteria bacterium]|jgi:hypothetical protein|nr:hypothetical protein [Candidatus Saccharibacteria bacterium]HPW47721.1 hypothetical protein [Candidatus Saccharibacteria bacterium]